MHETDYVLHLAVRTSAPRSVKDPSSPYSGVLAKFCTCFLEQTQPVVFGDGEQPRDFTGHIV